MNQNLANIAEARFQIEEILKLNYKEERVEMISAATDALAALNRMEKALLEDRIDELNSN